ncbi:MAG: hypothetical protein ACHQUC_05035 [Chlamydiales bacterium]
MEQTSTTVEMDHSNFDDLKNQLMGSKEESHKTEQTAESQEVKAPKTKKEPTQYIETKRSSFRKGDKSFDVDEDAEIEIMADKKSMKLTLRELKDRAAGDIAVKNRMHSLAEEKKRIQSTFKQFTEIAKKDPLGSLEYISKMAKEADGDFEYQKYLEMLADQAEKLGNMDVKDREALELKKKLDKAEQDLSLKQREALAVQRRQDILSEYPEIGDQQFGQMVNAVLNNEELLEGLESETDVLDKVEELIQETLTQRDIMTVIEEINPAHLKDTQLIFSLSDQLKQNPDLDEEDIRDIIRQLIKPVQRRNSIPSSSDRDNASRTLSSKQRQYAPVEQMQAQDGTDFDLLKRKLIENQDALKRTPIYMR